MRGLISAAVAISVMLVCAIAAAVVLLYVVTGNHGASWSNIDLAVPLFGWGFASGVALLRGMAWAPKCLLAWAVASSIGLGACAVAEALPWSYVGVVAAGLFAASLAVLGARRVTS